MLISYNRLKELVDFNLNPQELDHVLTMLGIEVESIVNYGEKYNNFFIGEVLEKEKHPNADKLSVCKVSIGSAVKNVVCGGPNVAKGQKVVLGLAGALVPSNGMVLEDREVRKIVSEGMICSQVELEMGDDKSGIWVLPAEAVPGTPLVDFLKLNDIVLEISITPNRADCLGHFGLAREIAAYCSTKVKYPELKFKVAETSSLQFVKISIQDMTGCPRYTGRVVRNVEVKESPDWLKQKLILLGMRPINIIVDVTNYVLIECGQPLHAFDLDKLAGNEIIVRKPNHGEKFTTLDSKERILDSDMVMICDGEKPVAVGGVMGGENSEITSETKNILIESAFFNPASVRRTAKKLGISSESSYRFERGVDIDNVVFANNWAAQLIAQLSGGEIQKELIDVYPAKIEQKKCTLRFERANKIIGASIPKENIFDMLQRLGFEILEKTETQITVGVPGYRVDIFEEIDIIEEIARLNDYDNLQPQFVTSVTFDRDRIATELVFPQMRTKLRNFLVENGFNETLTQNITDPVSAGFYEAEPVVIANPLGEEMSVMRTSLIPSMLRTIERNIRLGNQNLKLFEIGWTFHHVGKGVKTFIEGILEQEELIISITGKSNPVQWGAAKRNYDFYDIKGVFENLAGFFRFKNMKLLPVKDEKGVFSKNVLNISYKNEIIGQLGEISEKYLKKFDVEYPVFILLINLKKLYSIPVDVPKYSTVPPFPGSRRDLAFLLDKTVPANDVRSVIANCNSKILKKVDIFDVYEGKAVDGNKKSIAYSLLFSSPEKTLVEEEIDKVVNEIVKTIETKFSATLRK